MKIIAKLKFFDDKVELIKHEIPDSCYEIVKTTVADGVTLEEKFKKDIEGQSLAISKFEEISLDLIREHNLK